MKQNIIHIGLDREESALAGDARNWVHPHELIFDHPTQRALPVTCWNPFQYDVNPV